MTSDNGLLFSTFSPVRAPINTQSELRASMNNAEHERLKGKLSEIIEPHFNKIEQQYKNGYININSDNHPFFFQPIYIGKVDISSLRDELGERYTRLLSDDVAITRSELYFFDDTVAIYYLEVELNVIDADMQEYVSAGALDKDLTALVKDIYRIAMFPKFRLIADKLNSKAIANTIKPKEFVIFKDIDFETLVAPSSAVLWTGRLSCDSHEYPQSLSASLRRWVGLPEDQSMDEHYIGSGNYLIGEFEKFEDWFRVLVISQAYNAVLFIFNSSLKNKYSELAVQSVKRGVGQNDLNLLLSNTIRALEHIEFCKLEFNEAQVGTQSVRAKMMEDLCVNWKLEELQTLTIKRANLIKSRVDALLREQQTAVNKGIEFLLAAIGSLAIVDLTVSFVSVSKQLKEDSIPGLFDIFRILPANSSAWFSVAIVIVIFAYIRKVKN